MVFYDGKKNSFETKSAISLLLILLLILAVGGCAKSPTGRTRLMLVSPESAIVASKEAYINTIKPLNKEGKVDNDPALSFRVRNITGRIVHEAIENFPETSSWEWSVKVIDDPEVVNAWCMAGGKMAVYTGLIEQIHPTDDELAQVMAHEIGHAVANHTAERMSVLMAKNVGIMTMAIVLGDNEYRSLALGGAVVAANLAIQLPNSRTAEEEADRIGIELAARSGYDPGAAVTLWQKMGATDESRPPEFLSTHPSPDNRQQTLEKLVPVMMPYYKEKKMRLIYIFQ